MSIQIAESVLREEVKKYPDIDAKYKINLFAAAKAIIQIESDFNPSEIMDEKNVKDFSIGYMQCRIDTTRDVMVYMFKDVSYLLAAKDTIKKKLFDPVFNIKVGLRYLVYQIKRYNGDANKFVPAYNAGSAVYKNGKLINEGYLAKWKVQYKKYTEATK